VPEEEAGYSELRWGKNSASQTIHYVHGALQIFDTGTEIVKEQYDSENFIMENIGARLNRGEYPIFVTAGDGTEKLTQIRHNPYLDFCYGKLSEIEVLCCLWGFGLAIKMTTSSRRLTRRQTTVAKPVQSFGAFT